MLNKCSKMELCDLLLPKADVECMKLSTAFIVGSQRLPHYMCPCWSAAMINDIGAFIVR